MGTDYSNRDRVQRPYRPADLPVGAVIQIMRASTGNLAKVTAVTVMTGPDEVRVDVDGGVYVLLPANREVYAWPPREHDPLCFGEDGPFGHNEECVCWCHEEVEVNDRV
jgi:hypothetical protein